jgi:hypothetical protein
VELTWNTFDHLILEYEIPNMMAIWGNRAFRALPLKWREKVRFLMDTFDSQRSKRCFSRRLFSLMRAGYGMQCTTGYAEAFCRKLVLAG